jgi:hypothetical protein
MAQKDIAKGTRLKDIFFFLPIAFENSFQDNAIPNLMQKAMWLAASDWLGVWHGRPRQGHGKRTKKGGAKAAKSAGQQTEEPQETPRGRILEPPQYMTK